MRGEQDKKAQKAPVVALLAVSSFEFILTIFALNRLGYAVLFLSTRLTPPAYARLLEMTDAHVLIHSAPFTQTYNEITTERPSLTSLPILQRTNWHNLTPCPASIPAPPEETSVRSRRVAWILHSSGSTGHPKPIYLSNLQCLANFRKSFGLRAFCASPLFHSGGLMEVFRAFYTRATMYLGNHNLAVTSGHLLAAIRVARPKLVVAVPYVLQLIAETAAGIRALAEAELVLFNGSGCPDELGDRLVREGVILVANYGSTETGQTMTSFRPPGDTEWNYLRLWTPVADFVLMDEITPGVFECVALDGLPSKGPSNSVPPYSERNPAKSFRTADLFTRHPDPGKSNFYKYLARLDDRITLVMGEKVLPLPIGGRIRQSKWVREAVVFGFQRAVPGVLLFRAEGSEGLSEEEFAEAVWGDIEAANERAETFARVAREMVVVLGVEREYPRTDKGTFIRAGVYREFEAEIDAAYTRLESGQVSGGREKLVLGVEELEAKLLELFRSTLRIPLPNAGSDVFACGVDSLQTMRVWRWIRENVDVGGKTLGQNVVFEKGTIASLARYLVQLRTGEGDEEEEENEEDVMRGMIERFSAGFYGRDAQTTSTTRESGEVVIVTGATGNLGAFIVTELVRRPNVREVWTLVRAPDLPTAEARLASSLSSRSITLTTSEKAKVHALPSDLSTPSLNLSPATLTHLLASLTCVIHSAWPVNFNLPIRSFTPHIQGTLNLLNLCLRSAHNAPLLFCSSVSSVGRTPRPARIPESRPQNVSWTMDTGYGRSKFVTEHVVLNAAERTGMKARVLRIGQLSGDSGTGVWNETEAIALMVRSAISTGALPALQERVSWLPVDVCARAVVEAALDNGGGEEQGEVLHLVNPSTFSWTEALLPALRKSKLPAFEVVSVSEWLERLAASEQDPEKNPSIKLLDFWRAKYGCVKNAGGAAGLEFEVEKTVQACPSLKGLRDPASEGLMERYVDAWLRKWEVELK